MVNPVGPGTQRALDEALRNGPFGEALRAAIAHRGLSLESMQRRLRAEGFEVSLASLSYWQRGMRRPERADSLRALGAIERTLGLPGSSLVALLGPPRPRGRRPAAPPGPLGFEDTIGPQPGLAAVLDGLDLAVNLRVDHLSMQGERWLNPERGWYLERVRRIVRATVDGVDRCVAINVPDTARELPPAVAAVSGCRLGRARSDPDTGFHACELVFDQVLRAGQIHVFEYEYQARGVTDGVSAYVYGSRQPLRELVLRAHFDQCCVPVRSRHIRRDRHDEPSRLRAELRPSGAGTVTMVALDLAPGVEGIHWEWD